MCPSGSGRCPEQVAFFYILDGFFMLIYLYGLHIELCNQGILSLAWIAWRLVVYSASCVLDILEKRDAELLK